MSNVLSINVYREAQETRAEVYRECLFSQLMFGRVDEYGPSYQPRASEEELAQALASTSLKSSEIAQAKQIATMEADLVYEREVENLTRAKRTPS